MNLSRKHIPIIIGLVLLLFIVIRVAIYEWDQSHDENTWFEKVVLVTFDNDPELLSIHKPVIEEEFSRYKNRLTNISQKAELQRAEIARNYLLEWENLEHSSDDLKLDAKLKLIKNYLDYQAENDKYFLHWFPANPYNGVQVALPTFFSAHHAMDSEEDCNAYIARLKLVNEKINQAIEGIKLREEAGVIPPVELLQKTISQIDRFLAIPQVENPYYINFSRRVVRLGATEINEYEATRYLSHISSILEREILPAYLELKTTLEALVEGGNVQRWKGNTDYFAHQLRMLHREMSPEMIGRVNSELKENQVEYKDRLIEKLNMLDLPENDLSRQIIYLNQNYSLPGDSSTILLKSGQEILNDISMKSLGLFQTFEKPVRLEVASARVYLDPERINLLKNHAQNRAKGSLLIDIAKTTTHAIWRMKSDIYRRGVPGKFTLMKARADFLKEDDFWEILEPISFREGWGLYMDEVIANEIMLYSNHPVDEAGHLYNAYLDLLGARIDIQLHHEGMTYSEGLNFLIESAGLPEAEAQKLLEISVSVPGRLLAQWLGLQDILRLKTQAQEKLGNNFILQDFHDFMLARYPAPWELIEMQLENYFSEKLAS